MEDDAKEKARLRWQLTQLLNVRSVPTADWEKIWRVAGAGSGVLEEMSVGQLLSVIESVRRLPTMRAGKKSA